ncbi:MAG TPA: hypothetical protein VG267_12795 [Terracidiphilus sp.]|nr:hypothetical protein [Terracidiphilus sp.]
MHPLMPFPQLAVLKKQSAVLKMINDRVLYIASGIGSIVDVIERLLREKQPRELPVGSPLWSCFAVLPTGKEKKGSFRVASSKPGVRPI